MTFESAVDRWFDWLTRRRAALLDRRSRCNVCGALIPGAPVASLRSCDDPACVEEHRDTWAV